MNIYFLDLNIFPKKVLEDFCQETVEDISFGNKDKKLQHYAGIFLLQYALKKEYGIQNFEIETKNGKPFLKELPYFYSISHSKNMVGLAIGEKNVGFDIEYNKIARNFSAISKRYGEKINTQKEFYEFWTKHEAIIKLGAACEKPVCLVGLVDDDFTYSIVCEEPFVIYNVSTINQEFDRH